MTGGGIKRARTVFNVVEGNLTVMEVAPKHPIVVETKATLPSPPLSDPPSLEVQLM